MSDTSNEVRDPHNRAYPRAAGREGSFSQESRFSRGANGRPLDVPAVSQQKAPLDQRPKEPPRSKTAYAPQRSRRAPSHYARPAETSHEAPRTPVPSRQSTPSYEAVSRYSGAGSYHTKAQSAKHRRAQGALSSQQYASRQRPASHARPAHQRPRAKRAKNAPTTSPQSPQLARPVITNHAEGYQTRAPHQGPARRRSKAPKIIGAIAVVAAVVIAGVWLWTSGAFASEVTITVNDSEVVVKPGTTLTELVDEGYASPVAGNLMSIDGSLLQEGGGERFTGIVAGEAVPADYVVKANDDIIIADGKDATEKTTTEQVEIPFETATESESYGALHRYVEGQNGIAERVTGTVSGIVQERVIQEPVSAGYVQYNADTGEDKVVALTFDDGPWDGSTQEILDILAENDAKATFFTIGNQIASRADVVKKASEAGHQICTHSWDHADGSGQGVNLTFMSTDEQIAEIQKGFEAIESATGKEASTVIRSPGGNFYGEIINTLEPYISAEINWNIDTEDWKRPGVDAIVSAIKSAMPGDVILMHDGGGDRSQTVEALRTALPYLREQGFSFVTIDELLNYPIPTTAEVSDS